MDPGQEFRLLCSCAAVDLSSERATRIAADVGAGIDWSRFLHSAEHHGLLPLVARNLGDVAAVPPEIAHRLRAAFETNVRRNLWFASELSRIAALFEAKGLCVVSYKGPLLAEGAYGDVALRTFGDLDFLVSPGNLAAAKSALAHLGYRPSEELSPAVERLWQRFGYELPFDGAAGRYLVELQWGLTPYFYAVNLRADELLHRSCAATISNHPVRTLSPEDTLLVLCLHAAKHLWMRLIWVCDIAQTIRTQTIDYTSLLSRARSLGIMRITLLSFWLAQRLLDAPIPSLAAEGVSRDTAIAALGEELAARIARGATYDFESPAYFRWIPRLREHRSDRWRYFWRLFWTPGVGDLAAVRLPEVLFPLYRLVRVARLARRFLWPGLRSVSVKAS